MELKQHPLSAAFPAMSADDFLSLKTDIEHNGQREPVMLFEGMVLDGWHRYRACAELGIKATQFTFDVNDDAAAFVLSHNLHRRHLTPSQRAAAVVACAEWAPPHRLKNKQATLPASIKTNADMAHMAGTSERVIKDAKTAHKAGLTDVVRDGTMSANKAAELARGKPAKAPIAAKKNPPSTTPAPTPQPELDDAREAVSILAEENERLNDRLAVEAMDASEEEKLKAAATIAELRAELKTANAELRAVRAVRDDYMRENAELKKTIESQKRKLKKLEVPA